MRICVVGSCGKKKKSTHPSCPSCSAINSKEDLYHWQKKFQQLCYPAREMYLGNQNRELVKGADLLRTIQGVEVDLYIVSAGFGFLEEDVMIPPYDCTFSGMKKQELLERARRLGIPEDFRERCVEKYDLMYLALGKDYFLSLGSDWMSSESACVIQFTEKNVSRNHIWFPSDNAIVKAFSANGHTIHGAAGFKGDLLRILAKIALDRADSYGEIVGWTEPTYLKQLFADLYRSKQSVLDSKV